MLFSLSGVWNSQVNMAYEEEPSFYFSSGSLRRWTQARHNVSDEVDDLPESLSGFGAGIISSRKFLYGLNITCNDCMFPQVWKKSPCRHVWNPPSLISHAAKHISRIIDNSVALVIIIWRCNIYRCWKKAKIAKEKAEEGVSRIFAVFWPKVVPKTRTTKTVSVTDTPSRQSERRLPPWVATRPDSRLCERFSTHCFGVPIKSN